MYMREARLHGYDSGSQYSVSAFWWFVPYELFWAGTDDNFFV